MVAVAVRDDRQRDRLQGVDVETAGRAVEAFRTQLNQVAGEVRPKVPQRAMRAGDGYGRGV